MIAIVAVAKDWGIGKDNRLLFSIPEDMKFFRQTTKGHVVVMGRKTLESFPGGEPLKNRVNIVLTRNPNYDAKGAQVVCSIEELLKTLESYADEPIFIIGGGSIYQKLLAFTDTALITKVEKNADADTFFPNLDEDPNWVKAEESEEKESNGYKFRFTTYKRKGA